MTSREASVIFITDLSKEVIVLTDCVVTDEGIWLSYDGARTLVDTWEEQDLSSGDARAVETLRLKDGTFITGLYLDGEVILSSWSPWPNSTTAPDHPYRFSEAPFDWSAIEADKLDMLNQALVAINHKVKPALAYPEEAVDIVKSVRSILNAAGYTS